MTEPNSKDTTQDELSTSESPPRESDASEEEMEQTCVLLPVPSPYAAWIAYALREDLRRWGSTRRTVLKKEDAIALYLFLMDLLPEPDGRADRTA